MATGKVTKNTVFLVSGLVGQKLLAFIYFTLVARYAGVDGSGRYFVAMSFTTIFSIFVDLQLSSVVVRETAKFPNRARKLLANALGVKAILAALTVLAVWGAARLLGYPAETRTMIGIASVVMVLDSTHLVFYAVMRGLQNLRYEAIGMVTGQVLTITAGLTFIALKLPLPYLVVAFLCGSAWNVVWSGLVLWRRYGIRPAFELDPTTIGFFRQVAVPFALAGIFSRVYSYIDSIMLSRLVSDRAVGFYSVAYKITFAFQFLPMAFAAAIFPAMSEYYVTDRSRLGASFVTALKYLSAIVAPVTVGIFVLAGPIIRLLYGPQFAGSVRPLQIIIFALVFGFLYWPCGSLLNACDRQAKNTWVMGATMFSNIILNAFLIPRFEASGAAAAALMSNAILFALALYFVGQVTPYDRRKVLVATGKIFGSAAIMGLALAPLAGHFSIILLIPLGALIYGGVMLAVRAVTVAEVRSILDLFLKRGARSGEVAPLNS